jgi:hypothetical protein
MEMGGIQEIAEDSQAQNPYSHEQHKSLGEPAPWQRAAAVPTPDEEEWRHHQRAEGIAEPPGAPRLPIGSGGDDPPQPPAGHPQGGADQGTEACCQPE